MAEQPAQPDDNPRPCDVFVGLEEVALRLGVSPRTVRRMVERGELPRPCLSAGGRPRWLWSYIVEYCRKQHERAITVDRRLRKKLE